MYCILNIQSLNAYFKSRNIPIHLDYDDSLKMVLIREHFAFYLNQNITLKKWLKHNIDAEFDQKFLWHVKNLSKISNKIVKFKTQLTKEEILSQLTHYINQIKEQSLKESLNLLFKNHAEISSYPASLYNHHVYPQGLLEHIVQSLTIANSIYTTLCNLNLDLDLIIAGIILHDIGKIFTYDRKGSTFTFNEKGKQLGHIGLSVLTVSKEIKSTKLEKLIHIIQSHHYDLKCNISPTIPQISEAWIVFTADLLSTKLMG